MTRPTDGLSLILPAPASRWGDSDVASFVGQRVHLEIGPLTFVGLVSFARGAGDRDDDTLTASHVEVQVNDFRWAQS